MGSSDACKDITSSQRLPPVHVFCSGFNMLVKLVGEQARRHADLHTKGSRTEMQAACLPSGTSQCLVSDPTTFKCVKLRMN